MCAEMLVGSVEVFAAEKQASIVMGGDTRRNSCGGPLVSFVSGIQHQLGAVQLEPCPIAVVPGFRCGVHSETQHVAIEPDRGRHVEDLQQGTNTVNVHKALHSWRENISRRLNFQKVGRLVPSPVSKVVLQSDSQAGSSALEEKLHE